MNRKDMDNLFELLEIYFPNSKKTRNKTLKSAWFLLLEPFDPETVKQALVDQLRENKFFPDPQSIASRCPPVLNKVGGYNNWWRQPSWQRQRKLLDKYAELAEKWRKCGIPSTLEEARSSGLSAEDWDRMTTECGLGLEVIFAGYGEEAERNYPVSIAQSERVHSTGAEAPEPSGEAEKQVAEVGGDGAEETDSRFSAGAGDHAVYLGGT